MLLLVGSKLAASRLVLQQSYLVSKSVPVDGLQLAGSFLLLEDTIVHCYLGNFRHARVRNMLYIQGGEGGGVLCVLCVERQCGVGVGDSCPVKVRVYVGSRLLQPTLCVGGGACFRREPFRQHAAVAKACTMLETVSQCYVC